MSGSDLVLTRVLRVDIFKRLFRHFLELAQVHAVFPDTVMLKRGLLDRGVGTLEARERSLARVGAQMADQGALLGKRPAAEGATPTFGGGGSSGWSEFCLTSSESAMFSYLRTCELLKLACSS